LHSGDNEVEDVTSADAGAEAELPPRLSATWPQDERYFALLTAALRTCREYKPKFGQGRGAGLTFAEFSQLYSADPFYHWLGIDSPLMYAAHKAAGGMTSVYRQIGIGCQWILVQMLQDCLQLSPEQATWGYTIEGSRGAERKLSLDGRIDLEHISDSRARKRVEIWIAEAAAVIGLPEATLASIKGVVFEARQGYKSKDSKRQNADIANAAKAYAHLYIPTILLFSTQIDADVARRYRESMWLLLNRLLPHHDRARQRQLRPSVYVLQEGGGCTDSVH
jgi:hypothetical protein